MIVLSNLIPRGQNAPRIFRNVVDIADVVIEMRTGLCHTIEMFGLEQRPLQAPALLHFVEFPICKRQGGLESVLDLPAVPVAGRLVLVIEPVFFGELADLGFGEIKLEARISKTQQAALPDF